jgi:hypothetical protein
MTVDDPGEDVGQISERIDVLQLAGLDQRGNGGPVLGATVRTCEQSVFSVERNYPSILPISGRMLKSFIAGMRFMDAVFA